MTSPASREEQRILNQWNARRHGQAAFQTGSRRAAERILRRTADEHDNPNRPA